MLRFQNVLRLLISLLVLVLGVLSVLGMLWWEQPPERLAGYERGGQLILGLLVAVSLAGLWVLWSPARRRDA